MDRHFDDMWFRAIAEYHIEGLFPSMLQSLVDLGTLIQLN